MKMSSENQNRKSQEGEKTCFRSYTKTSFVFLKDMRFRWNWRMIVTEQKRAARSPVQVWVITKNGDSTDLNVTETESGTETETDIGETKVAQICEVIWKDLSKLILSYVIPCAWPNQLYLWALMYLIILFLVMLFNPSCILILLVPLLSIIGLNILVNIFL